MGQGFAPECPTDRRRLALFRDARAPASRADGVVAVRTQTTHHCPECDRAPLLDMDRRLNLGFAGLLPAALALQRGVQRGGVAARREFVVAREYKRAARAPK